MNKPSTCLASALLLFALSFRATARIDFTDAILLKDDAITNLTSATINEWPLLEEGLRFAFQTDDKNRAVWMGGNRDLRNLDVRALGFPVYEAQAAFHPQSGALTSVELVLFSRGDVTVAGGGANEFGELLAEAVHNQSAFRELCTRAKSPIETAFGKPTQSNVRRPVKNHEQRQLLWKTVRGNVLLSVGRTKGGDSFRGEYIRVTISPPAEQEASRPQSGSRPIGMGDAGKTTARSSDLTKNIVREEDGTVFIDNIPMVDQGDKGYCTVATIERIVRYFGGATSQHELAQLMNTGDGGGTGVGYNQYVSPAVCKRFGFKQEKVPFRIPETEDILRKYNSIATVKIPKKTPNFLEVADKDTLHKAVSGMRECRDFISAVRKHADKGEPLLWSVPGHTRLIVGYNEKSSRILYSDSWGGGHERKEMSAAEALLMTQICFAVHP